MPALFLYLLKANLILTVFAGIYYLVFRYFTFYRLNRFFLVIALLSAVVLPFLTISWSFLQTHSIHFTSSVASTIKDWHVEQVHTAQSNEFTFWQAFVWGYWIGVLLMTYRFLMQLLSLAKLHQNSTVQQFLQYRYRNVRECISPFSFGGSIYIHLDTYNDQEKKIILTHEQVHVQEWHTLDLLLVELITVFDWCSPTSWFMRAAIKQNLEFIADKAVLRTGVDRKTYQYSLLKVIGLPNIYATSSFQFAFLKRRIQMMNGLDSSGSKLLYYPFLICVAVFSILVVSGIVTQSFAEVKQPLLQTSKLEVSQPLRFTLPSKEPRIIPLDTPQGTWALAQKIRLSSKSHSNPSPDHLILFLKNSGGVAMDVFVKFKGESLDSVRILAVAKSSEQAK